MLLKVVVDSEVVDELAVEVLAVVVAGFAAYVHFLSIEYIIAGVI